MQARQQSYVVAPEPVVLPVVDTEAVLSLIHI